MTPEPRRLPVPDHLRDDEGNLRVSGLWQHYRPSLSWARHELDAALASSADPVPREAVRLRNARTLECDH